MFWNSSDTESASVADRSIIAPLMFIDVSWNLWLNVDNNIFTAATWAS